MENSSSNEDFLNNSLEPEKAVGKKMRRGKRGSKSGKKLCDITQRVESEIRKYEQEEMKKISDNLSKQPVKGKSQLKKFKTGKKEMGKINKNLVDEDDQNFQYFDNDKPLVYQKKVILSCI